MANLQDVGTIANDAAFSCTTISDSDIQFAANSVFGALAGIPQ